MPVTAVDKAKKLTSSLKVGPVRHSYPGESKMDNHRHRDGLGVPAQAIDKLNGTAAEHSQLSAVRIPPSHHDTMDENNAGGSAARSLAEPKRAAADSQIHPNPGQAVVLWSSGSQLGSQTLNSNDGVHLHSRGKQAMHEHQVRPGKCCCMSCNGELHPGQRLLLWALFPAVVSCVCFVVAIASTMYQWKGFLNNCLVGLALLLAAYASHWSVMTRRQVDHKLPCARVAYLLFLVAIPVISITGIVYAADIPDKVDARCENVATDLQSVLSRACTCEDQRNKLKPMAIASFLAGTILFVLLTVRLARLTFKQVRYLEALYPLANDFLQATVEGVQRVLDGVRDCCLCTKSNRTSHENTKGNYHADGTDVYMCWFLMWPNKVGKGYGDGEVANVAGMAVDGIAHADARARVEIGRNVARVAGAADEPLPAFNSGLIDTDTCCCYIDCGHGCEMCASSCLCQPVCMGMNSIGHVCLHCTCLRTRSNIVVPRGPNGSADVAGSASGSAPVVNAVTHGAEAFGQFVAGAAQGAYTAAGEALQPAVDRVKEAGNAAIEMAKAAGIHNAVGGAVTGIGSVFAAAGACIRGMFACIGEVCCNMSCISCQGCGDCTDCVAGLDCEGAFEAILAVCAFVILVVGCLTAGLIGGDVLTCVGGSAAGSE